MNMSRSLPLTLSCVALGVSLGAALWIPFGHHACPDQTSRISTQPSEIQSGLGLEPGDRVVSLWKDAWWEATVVTVQGQLIKLAWDQPPPEISYRGRDRVQRMDAHPETARAGDWLLCPSSGVWNACFVDSVDGATLNVIDPTNRTRSVTSLGQVLDVPPGLRAWVAERGAPQIARFRAEARLRDLVPSTVGHSISAGMHVLARWSDGNWWEATVESIHGGMARVAWADGSAPTDVAIEHVAPILRDLPTPTSGDLVLCKWQQSTRWWRAYIERDAGALGVVYIDGTREPLAGQCVAAEHGDLGFSAR